MRWQTSISTVNGGQEIIRGYNLHELVQQKTFVEVIFLILRGELPSAPQTRMLNALLAMMIDHGIGIGSTMSARLVSSLGNSLHTSVATGILGLGGERHGGALEGAAKFFQEYVSLVPSSQFPQLRQGSAGQAVPSSIDALVKDLKQKKIRIPGFGHRVLTHDHRTDTLFAVAKETGCFGKYCEFALTVGEALNKISSKPLPLNMDGATAAILSDMGFEWSMVTGFFIIGRVPGLVAHVAEEMNSKEGLRRLGEDEIEYTGRLPGERS